MKHTAAILLTVLAATPLHAQPVPDGWRDYHLGMTLDEARRLPGQWEETVLGNQPKTITSRGLKDSVRDYDRTFHVNLTFLADQTLFSVNLEEDGVAALVGEPCEAEYAKLIATAEARHGAFAISQATDALHTRDPKLDITVHAAGKASHYSRWKLFPDSQPVQTLTASAERDADRRAIAVTMNSTSFRATGSCKIRIVIAGLTPAPNPADTHL
jgi:hypothetical protein